MIAYLSPGQPDTISGGTRKLYDHVAILCAHGYDARIVYTHEIGAVPDLIVVPEVYGDGIRDFVPAGWPRVIFVQNGYLIDAADGVNYIADPERHPYMTTPELVAVLTESEHTTDLVRAKFPDLPVPIIRTHSSGNGRNGGHAGFRYGSWPRARRVVYFDYKHAHVNGAIFDDLDLPPGWDTMSMTGCSDEQIAEHMRTASIFAAANTHEGMCAPTSEAMISGAVNVCWTGGGPDEYLLGRAVIAEQDNVSALREAIVDTAYRIDLHPEHWSLLTRAWSDWFQATYSRDREVSEIVGIMEQLGMPRKVAA